METESQDSARKGESKLERVIIQLKATADAPILKQKKFKMLGTDKFAKVIDFLRRQIHRETVFVYINSAFSPNPDELVIDLFNWRGANFHEQLCRYTVHTVRSFAIHYEYFLDSLSNQRTSLQQPCNVLCSEY
ncbi:hypothetical protein D5086_001525 [Populus alba]|uniref:Uncharacterized protein n=1 Tax=Populus alba TaxID=43335 RepID=A0ACC4CZ55_POPAL